MTKEEWIKIYNVKDGTWDTDDLIDKAYEIITSPIKTNYDCIKSMSVEEMAVNLAKIQCDAIEQTTMFAISKELREQQYELCKQWLEQEVS